MEQAILKYLTDKAEFASFAQIEKNVEANVNAYEFSRESLRKTLDQMVKDGYVLKDASEKDRPVAYAAVDLSE